MMNHEGGFNQQKCFFQDRNLQHRTVFPIQFHDKLLHWSKPALVILINIHISKLAS